jgi:predicted TIM-barrel fold metal-dependent hydrolase
MIIDGHLLIATPPDELDAYGRFLAAHGRNKGWDAPEPLLDSLAKDGVDYGLILEGPNRLREKFVARDSAHLGAFAAVSLRDLASSPAKTIADARARIRDGFLGFGQITPYREGMSLDDPPLLALFTLASELGVPVHIECTCSVGAPTPGRVNTPLYDYETVARRFPSLSIILGSWGGTICLYEMTPELPRIFLNVYYDTYSPVDAFDVGIMLATTHKIIRSRKILFGSGSPMAPRRLSDYKSADVPAEVLFGVLGNNYRLLLGLP